MYNKLLNMYADGGIIIIIIYVDVKYICSK